MHGVVKLLEWFAGARLLLRAGLSAPVSIAVAEEESRALTIPHPSADNLPSLRVSRWALRCSACYFVTKEAGRLFCPRCGNMTMDRVEVTVGPGGAEFFGVRKKFILRGTKYSLPKPKVSCREFWIVQQLCIAHWNGRLVWRRFRAQPCMLPSP